jgi:RIO kinase 1
MQSAWVDAEWSALNLLKDARLPVPAPYARTAGSIAMEFVPSARGSAEPAPRLRDVELSPDQAREALDTLLGFVQETLARDMIHGDLSPFNVLWSDEAAVVIDFPQFVDARNHSRAYEMLVRDVRNVCEHLERFGARPPESASAFADRLWSRFERNDLYPGDWERERAALAV